MVWARLDDEILDNDKIVRAGILGFALHVAAVTWCCRNLTDGFIPRRRALTLFDMEALREEYVDAIGTHPEAYIDKLYESLHDMRPPTAAPAVERLVDCQLWSYDEARDGYWLKDFLVYNPSREKVLAERARGKERKSVSRHVGLSQVDSGRNPCVTRRGIRSVSRVDSASASDGPVPDPVNTKPPCSPPAGGTPPGLIPVVAGNEPAREPVKKRDDRGTRLPADWHPSPELVARLRKKYAYDPLLSLDRFKNFWLSKPGKDGRKLDWDRTFDNWVEKDAAMAQRTPFRRDEPAPAPYHAPARSPLDRPLEGPAVTKDQIDALTKKLGEGPVELPRRPAGGRSPPSTTTETPEAAQVNLVPAMAIGGKGAA